MIDIQFADKDLEALIKTGKNLKYKKYSRDNKFMKGLAMVYRILTTVENVNGLNHYSMLHYEKLKYVGNSSVRIVNGMVERLIFKESENGLEIKLLKIDSEHYGNKK